MYLNFFGFDELPFSIVPNARYLYLSQRHQEAIVHLQAGLGDGGGFAMLTGEVGTENHCRASDSGEFARQNARGDDPQSHFLGSGAIGSDL